MQKMITFQQNMKKFFQGNNYSYFVLFLILYFLLRLKYIRL